MSAPAPPSATTAPRPAGAPGAVRRRRKRPHGPASATSGRSPRPPPAAATPPCRSVADRQPHVRLQHPPVRNQLAVRRRHPAAARPPAWSRPAPRAPTAGTRSTTPSRPPRCRGARRGPTRERRRSTDPDHRTPPAHRHPEASSSISLACAGSTSWYSSTKIRRTRVCSAASSVSSASSAERRPGQLRLVKGGAQPAAALPEVGDVLVLAGEQRGRLPLRPLPAATQIGQPAGGDAPLGGAQHQVPQFGSERGRLERRADRRRPTAASALLLAGQQFADHLVGLPRAEQPWRRFAGAHRLGLAAANRRIRAGCGPVVHAW